MNKRKSLIILGSSLSFAFLCFALSFIYIQTQLKLVDVVVSTHHLKAREIIEENDVKIVQMPKQYVSTFVVNDIKEVIGKIVVIDGFIPSSTMIHTTMIEPLDDTIDQPSLLLKENQALFALDASLISTAGNSYVVNQKVDIYGAIKLRDKVVVDRLISSVRIVGIKDKNGNDVDKNNDNLPKVILLALERSGIPVLTKLQAMGEISLSANSYLLDEGESVIHIESTLWSLLNAS